MLHQVTRLGSRVSQRGWQGAPQGRAGCWQPCPLVFRQGQAGNNKVSEERQRRLPIPLHCAAAGGHTLAAVLLLAAAPEAAAARNTLGWLPLQQALERQHMDAARCLLASGPAAEVIHILQQHGQGALPLFADYVVARLPLSGDDWALLPRHCSGLGRALPAALAHSASQASSLVQHLPAADAERLLSFALCLARMQRRVDIQLPVAIIDLLLSHFDMPILS